MRIFTIQEDPLPEFEVDEKPEAVAMLSDACSMVFGQSSEASGFKESPLKRPRSQDKLPGATGPSEPETPFSVASGFLLAPDHVLRLARRLWFASR